jgi:hypothetical protein
MPAYRRGGGRVCEARPRSVTKRLPTARRSAPIGAILIAIVLAVLLAPSARAAQVSGTLTGYGGSTPQANRYLHFENRITHDIYVAPTVANGSFGAELPPGEYELRAERGAILAPAIEVGAADVPLGAVSELAPYALSRLWDLQSIAPAQLTSAAPSTANLMTRDISGFVASVAETRPANVR